MCDCTYPGICSSPVLLHDPVLDQQMNNGWIDWWMDICSALLQETTWLILLHIYTYMHI